MSNTDSSEGSSLYGDLVDIALGSDLDGLTDREINEELEEQSDSDDGINVTIKEGIKPNLGSDQAVTTPKLASEIVVPNSTKRTLKHLLHSTEERQFN